jgi:predicted Zn-dependent protease
LNTLEWLGLFAAAFALAIAVASALIAPEESKPVRWEQTTVAPGATLWTLAAENPVPGLSVTETVDLIRAENALASGLLCAGQTLTVPVVSAADVVLADH